MADWFAHRLDAEEIARDRTKRTTFIHIVRTAKASDAHPRGGFLVIRTQRRAERPPLSEIKLADREPAPAPMKRFVGTIDCTPTWAATLPSLLLLLEEGNAEGQLLARDELKRMAALADLWVASQKTEKAA